jgi:hypothetical protein
MPECLIQTGKSREPQATNDGHSIPVNSSKNGLVCWYRGGRLVVGRFIAHSWLFRGLLFSFAIGCWLSFVPCTRADGPILVFPVPQATDALPIPDSTVEQTAESPDADGPVLGFPDVDTSTVKIPAPSLDESSERPRLPILSTPAVDQMKAPSAVPAETPKPNPESQHGHDEESEFVTVRSRKRKKGLSGEPLQVEPLPETRIATLNPLLIRETPADEVANDPYPLTEVDVGVDPLFLTPVEPRQESLKSITPGELNRLIDKIVLTAVPSRYTDDDQWGKTKTITAGVDLGMKGLFLRATRTTREVNHGTWKKFEIDRKPSQTPYTVTVSKLKMNNDRQFQFSAEYRVPLSTQAHRRSFNRGVRLRSLSVDAQAIVQLSVECTVNFDLVPGVTPADPKSVILDPVVDSGKLRLVEFNPAKISRLKGSTGRELGRDTERVVKQQLKKLQPGLTVSLNNQLAQQRFRVPLNDLLHTKWGRMLAGSTDLDK